MRELKMGNPIISSKAIPKRKNKLWTHCGLMFEIYPFCYHATPERCSTELNCEPPESSHQIFLECSQTVAELEEMKTFLSNSHLDF